MVKNSIIPERGDIVWVDFSPTRGREQSGLRPGVVLSASEYNSLTGLAVICPMTTKSKGFLFEVSVKGPKGKSFVLADQIRAFDFKERVEKIEGKVSESEINEILARTSVLFK